MADGKISGGILSMPNASDVFVWSGGTLATTVNLGSAGNVPTMSIIDGVILDTQTFKSYANATWTAGNISLKNNATFENDGVFDVKTDTIMSCQIGGQFTNNGTFKKSTGTADTTIVVPFTNAGSTQFLTANVHFGDALSQSGGTTTLSGGNMQTDQTFKITGGQLNGVGTITGSVNNTGGTVVPGLNGTPGNLNIIGNYTQAGPGQLTINIDATGNFGILNVEKNSQGTGGTATLGGTLDVNNPAYKPTSGDLYFLTYAAVAGDFSTLSQFNWFGPGPKAYHFVGIKGATSYDLHVAPV